MLRTACCVLPAVYCLSCTALVVDNGRERAAGHQGVLLSGIHKVHGAGLFVCLCGVACRRQVLPPCHFLVLY
jgi:hypothetical protein